jgi:ERCC4-type nuclease
MNRPPKAEGMTCPFTVVIDTRESRPYTFEAIRADVAQGGHQMIIPTVRLCLNDGDYSVFSLPGVAVERKSLADLFSSVARRDNFVARLERLSSLRHASVVVEAEISEIMTRPPAFSRLRPKSVMRTILAWQMRYPVRWWFMPGREAGEVWTFRILERFYRDHKGEMAGPDTSGMIDLDPLGEPAARDLPPDASGVVPPQSPAEHSVP